MKTSKLSERAVEFILTRSLNELARLTETQVSEKLGANKAFLCQIFKSVQNISLKGFILREKLHRATFILEKVPGISIEELSVKLGFQRTEHFIKEFENYLAIKPGRYKELKNQSKNHC